MSSQSATLSIDRTAPSQNRTALESLQEYGRGIAGGLLFSLPLLYTMEVWQAGYTMQQLHQLAYVVVTFALLLGYNRYAGLRSDANWLEVGIDSVEEMGIGLVLALALLLLLGRLDLTMNIGTLVGQIVLEAMPAAIGVSVGTAQLGDGGEQQGQSQRRATQDESRFFGQITLALCGAVLLAANVAPTEEILQIAVEAAQWQLLGLALASLLVGAVILFYSGFRGGSTAVARGGLLSTISSLVITYTVALLASAIILWFFDRFENVALSVCVAQTVVLGGAAMLGASAGRLLLQ